MQLGAPSGPHPQVWNFRSKEHKRADEQWMLHPSSINLVSTFALAFPLHGGNNDTLIHYPFIPVILVKLLNNMLQIRLHSHNSSCHLQCIILQTYSPLSLAVLWRLLSVTSSGCAGNREHHFRCNGELHWLICHGQKHNKQFSVKAKGTRVFILPPGQELLKIYANTALLERNSLLPCWKKDPHMHKHIRTHTPLS